MKFFACLNNITSIYFQTKFHKRIKYFWNMSRKFATGDKNCRTSRSQKLKMFPNLHIPSNYKPFHDLSSKLTPAPVRDSPGE